MWSIWGIPWKVPFVPQVDAPDTQGDVWFNFFLGIFKMELLCQIRVEYTKCQARFSLLVIDELFLYLIFIPGSLILMSHDIQL